MRVLRKAPGCPGVWRGLIPTLRRCAAASAAWAAPRLGGGDAKRPGGALSVGSCARTSAVSARCSWHSSAGISSGRNGSGCPVLWKAIWTAGGWRGMRTAYLGLVKG